MITKALLVSAGACSEQRALFEDMYPDGVKVTEKECAKAKDVFDLPWAASNLLAGEQHALYARLTAAAFTVYHQAMIEPAQRREKAQEAPRVAYAAIYEPLHKQYLEDVAALPRDDTLDERWTARYDEFCAAQLPAEEALQAAIKPSEDEYYAARDIARRARQEAAARAFAIAWRSSCLQP